jgi:hypothetical protein
MPGSFYRPHNERPGFMSKKPDFTSDAGDNNCMNNVQ